MTPTKPHSAALRVARAVLLGAPLAVALAARQTQHCLHLATKDRFERGSFEYVTCTRCDKIMINVIDTKDFIVWSSRWHDEVREAEADVRYWLDSPASVGLMSS